MGLLLLVRELALILGRRAWTGSYIEPEISVGSVLSVQKTYHRINVHSWFLLGE